MCRLRHSFGFKYNIINAAVNVQWVFNNVRL